MSKKRIPHRKWNKEEKMQIVHLHLDEHKSLRHLEKEYSFPFISEPTGYTSLWTPCGE